jgi:1-acyl-sn-glycerol-3-phosphate acyltransferase
MPTAQIGVLPAIATTLRCIAHLVRGMRTIRREFGHASHAERSAHITRWAQDFLRIVRVEVRTSGTIAMQGPLLVVANHISWLDILVLLAVQPVCFVSKSEIKAWPLIGWLATNVGTLYIERASRRDAVRVVHHIAQALQAHHAEAAQQIIAVFPEGTTTDGSMVLPFHANLIQSAISAHAPVQPVTLRYADPATGAHSLAPAYTDDDTLVNSVWRVLRTPGLHAQLSFAPVQHAQGRERRAWAADIRQAVVQALPAANHTTGGTVDSRANVSTSSDSTSGSTSSSTSSSDNPSTSTATQP